MHKEKDGKLMSRMNIIHYMIENEPDSLYSYIKSITRIKNVNTINDMIIRFKNDYYKMKEKEKLLFINMKKIRK